MWPDLCVDLIIFPLWQCQLFHKTSNNTSLCMFSNKLAKTMSIVTRNIAELRQPLKLDWHRDACHYPNNSTRTEHTSTKANLVRIGSPCGDRIRTLDREKKWKLKFETTLPWNRMRQHSSRMHRLPKCNGNFHIKMCIIYDDIFMNIWAGCGKTTWISQCEKNFFLFLDLEPEDNFQNVITLLLFTNTSLTKLTWRSDL